MTFLEDFLFKCNLDAGRAKYLLKIIFPLSAIIVFSRFSIPYVKDDKNI